MTTTAEPRTDVLEEINDRLAALNEEAEQGRLLRQTFAELSADLTPIAKQGLGSVTQLMATAEDKGYVEFTKGSLEVVDRVVTSYSKEDVEALGDNIVLILDTIKEMTQPQIMQMMRSTLHDISDVEESSEPPSLLAIVRRLRTPAARRGLHRLVFLLESLGSSASIAHRKAAQE